MDRIRRLAAYVVAFILLLVGYAAASAVAHVLLNLVNSDVQGWSRENVLPFFVALLAGPLGVLGGFAGVERFFPSLRLRPLAWTFAGMISVVWLWALLGMVIGVTPQDGIAAMAVQSIAATVASMKLSSREHRP